MNGDPLGILSIDQDPLGILEGNDPLGIIMQQKESAFNLDAEPLPEADVSSFGPRVVGAIAGGGVAFPASGLMAIGGVPSEDISGLPDVVPTESSMEYGGRKIAEIQSIPMKLLKTEQEQKDLGTLLWPIEKIQYASQWYGDWTLEKTNSPKLAALVATIVEASAYIALPALKEGLFKVRANIKAGKIAEARKLAVQLRKDSLKALQNEPRRLKSLVMREREIKNSYLQNPELLKPDSTYAKSGTPPTIETIIREAEAPMPEPEVPLRPDQRAHFAKRAIPESKTGQPLLKPKDIKAKTRYPQRPENVFDTAVKSETPVYEGKSDPYKVLPEPEKVAPAKPEKVVGGEKGIIQFKKKPIFDKGDFKPPKKRVSYKTKQELEEWIGDEIYDQALTSWEEHGIYQFLSRLRNKPKNTIKSLDIEDIIRKDATDRISKGETVKNFPERLLKKITEESAQEKYIEEWIKQYYPEVKNLSDFKGILFEAHTAAQETSVWWDDFIKNPKKYFGMIDETKKPAPAPEKTAKPKEPAKPEKVIRELEPAGEGYLTHAEMEKTKPKRGGAYDRMGKRLGEKYDAEYLGQDDAVVVKGDEKPSLLWSLKGDNRVFRTKGLNITELRMKTDYLKQQQGRPTSTTVRAETLGIAKPRSVKAIAKEGTTLSFLGTQGIYEGVAKEVPKFKEMGRKIAGKFDVESKFGEATETGFHAKNYFSKWAAWEERTLDIISKTAKIANYDKKASGLDAVLAIESRKSLAKAPKDIKAVGKVVLDFQEKIKKEYEKRGVKFDFKARIISDIKELIRNAEDSEIPALEKALKTAEDMNFLHIPTAMWIEGKLGSPESGKVLKLLATQKRKSLNIKSLIDRGLIKPEDVNVYDIMASYGRRAGRDFALLDLRDAAVKDGMAIKFTKAMKYGTAERSPANFTEIPAYEAPVFAGYRLHPILKDYIRTELLGKGLNLGKVGKAFALAKMSAFINPLILPMYDMVQHSMAALLNKWDLKSPLSKTNIPGYYLKEGIRHYLNRTPEYYRALDDGMSSKPYNSPFGTYENLVNWAKKNKREKALTTLRSVMPQRVVQSAYSASWEIAWQLDPMIRMGTYLMLRDKGFSPRAAAQMAAKFHSDYASVPASLRRKLNIPFFTPTFKLTMGKFYGRMGLDAVKYATRIGKVSPKSKFFAKALLATVAINEAYDIFMTQFAGFKRDEWGRRYYREIDTSEGKKELTITASSPHNMWQKYVFRAISSRSPEVEKPLIRFFEQNKWEIQPVWRVTYEIATNKTGKGDSIVNTFDTEGVKAAKRVRYAIKSIVRLIGLVDRDPADKEGIEKFKQEYGKLTEIITRPFTFIYTRSPEDRRLGFKVKAVQIQFNKLLRKGKIEPRHVDEYIKKLDKLLKEYK